MKRVCIKELPRTLILHLKRFEFDLDFMKKVKVNDCCEFPTRLNMHPYTLAGIEEREKAIAEAVITFDSTSTTFHFHDLSDFMISVHADKIGEGPCDCSGPASKSSRLRV